MWRELASLRAVSTNPIYALFATPPSLAPFFLRFAVATIFFYHGAKNVFGAFGGDGWHKTIEAWASPDGPALPAVVTMAVIVAQLVIPLSMIFGLFTRLAALATVIMAGELYYVSTGTTFDAIELPLMILAAGLALLFFGGGYMSLDRSISKNLLPHVG